jgi:hypothetical protein
MQVAAVLALLGLPALRYLETTDPEERLILNALAHRAEKEFDRLQHNQAAKIVNAMIKSKVFR